MAATNSPGATNLTKLQIDEMKKELTNYGFNAKQFKENYPAVPALAQSGAARDDDGDAVSSGGHGGDVKDDTRPSPGVDRVGGKEWRPWMFP